MAGTKKPTIEPYQIVRHVTPEIIFGLYAPNTAPAANPQCPSGIMQWQHGTYTVNPNNTLTLNPIAVDGRQLQSDPCTYKNSIYTRYNQTENFKVRLPHSALPSFFPFDIQLTLNQSFSVYTDKYHNVPRLDLFRQDGSPMNPMYLVYSPPQMLPTLTLNPTATPTGATKSTSTASSKRKRSVGEGIDINQNILLHQKMAINADRFWWVGAGMIAVGSIGYFCF